jgi:hypothetical protein
MIATHEKIIAEYRDADFNRRLHMYLQFPDLRSAFILMDQNDLNTDASAAFKSGRNSLAAQMSGVLCSAAGCVKKLFGLAAP